MTVESREDMCHELVDNDRIALTTPPGNEMENLKLEFSKLQPEQGLTLLMFASMTGNDRAIAALLKGDQNVNERDCKGLSALSHAVLHGHLKCVQILVTNCADINNTDENDDTPLTLAAKYGFEDIVKYLLSIGGKKGRTNYKALSFTALNNDLKSLKILIKCGININCPDANGVTVLMKAAAQGLSEIVECLVEAGAYVVALDNIDSKTPLIYAAMNGHHTIVEYLVGVLGYLEYRIPVYQMKSALCYAAEFGHLECVKVLVNRTPIKIDTTDTEGKTPLMHAILQNHPETAEYLLCHGANCDITSHEGMNVIHYAAVTGNVASLQNLFMYDKRKIKRVLNLRNTQSQTPLMIAALNCQKKVVKYLIQEKANVNRRCNKGWTALHYAVQGGDVNCIDTIVNCKDDTDINVQTKEGRTPLMIACSNAMHSVVELLSGLGGNTNIQCKEGRNALHYAVQGGNIECLQELLTEKAHLNIRDKHGDTPLILALRLNQTKIAETLIKYGAIVDTQNNEGKTALHCACDRGNLECVQFLIDAKANMEQEDKQKQTAATIAFKMGHAHIVSSLSAAGAKIPSLTVDDKDVALEFKLKKDQEWAQRFC